MGNRTQKRGGIPESAEAPVKEGEELGTVRYSLDGTLLLECPVVADRDVAGERTFRRVSDG